MKVEIDIESQSDIERLSKLLGLVPHDKLVGEQNTNVLLRAQIESFKKTDGKIKPISTSAAIRQVLEKYEMLTAYEMLSYIDVSEEQIRSVLGYMMKDGEVLSSTSSPKKYYLKRMGNSELREMVPPGTKVQVMG